MSISKAEEELQNILVETYFRNLEFLKEKDNKLYQRVDAISSAISEGVYKERYQLEFIKEDGDFDIYDAHMQSYLYNKKPKKYNSQARDKINFNQKGSFDILDPFLFNKYKELNSSVDKDNLQESVDSLTLLCQNISKYEDILKEDFRQRDKQFKSFSKFMFIGTLLGRHIPSIVKKLKATHYFVYEANLEIFRLSLFVVDYTILTNGAHVMFSIMEDDSELEQRVSSFLFTNNWENHILKFHTTDYNVDNVFERILNAIVKTKPTIFNYYRVMYTVVRNRLQRINKYKFIYVPLMDKIPLLSKNRVIYVCPGPSLEDNIQWLCDHKNEFIIVTVGAAYKKLLAVGIEPDILFTVDPGFEILKKLQFDRESTKKIQNCIVLASSSTDQRILERFNPKKTFLYETNFSIKKRAYEVGGFSVGETGYKFLIELGVKELYLLGTDLAVDQVKGRTHGESSFSLNKTYDLENVVNSMDKGKYSLRGDLIKVKGNQHKSVWTSRLLNSSLQVYQRIKIPQEMKVFNLCTHGAFINHTLPTYIKDVNFNEHMTINKDEEYRNQLLKQLESVSQLGLDHESLEVIKKYNENVNIILEKINKYKQEKITSYKEFQTLFIDVFKHVLKIKDESGYDPLTKVLTFYLPVINAYIDYALTQKKVKNESKKVQKISLLWFEDIEVLLKDYLRYAKEVVTP